MFQCILKRFRQSITFEIEHVDASERVTTIRNTHTGLISFKYIFWAHVIIKQRHPTRLCQLKPRANRYQTFLTPRIIDYIQDFETAIV